MKVVRKTTSGALQLSSHFYLAELTASDTADRAGIDNTPNPLIVQNLFRMAKLAEQVRSLLGDKVMTINSGYRGPELNALIGGAKFSDHLTGEAMDFVCRSYGTPLQVAAAIAKSSLKWGQLIQEGSWVHLSLPCEKHNQEVMTAHFTGGKASYTQGL